MLVSIRSIAPLIGVIPLVLLGFYAFGNIDGLIFFERDFYLQAFSLILLLLVILSGRQQWTFDIVDVMVFVYCLYRVYLGVVTGGGRSNTFNPFFLFVVYYSMKRAISNSEGRRLLHLEWIILVGFSLYACHGLLQVLGISTRGSFARASGFYINPAPFAGILISMVSFPLNKAMVNKNSIVQNEVSDLYIYFLTFVGLISIIFTESRAALLAAIVSFTFLCGTYNYFDPFCKIKNGLKASVIVVGLGMLSTILYLVRPDSANSRLLIWKIAISEMMMANPILGSGPASFRDHYMSYQLNYFKDGSSSIAEQQVSGNVPYAYNEFVKIAVEEGILGLVFFLAIVGVSFYYSHKGWESRQETEKRTIRSAQAALLGMITFAFFSYPFQDITFEIIFWIVLCILSLGCPRVFVCRPSRYVTLFVTITVCIIAISIYPFAKAKYEAYLIWQKNHFTMKDQKALQAIYPFLSNEGEFYIDFAESFYLSRDYNTAIDILEAGKLHSSNPELFLKLARYYDEGKNNIEKAKENYLHVAGMLPYKFYPKYCLLKLYERNGMNNDAINLAKEIIDMPVKLPSRAVDDMKKHASNVVIEGGREGASSR